MSSNEQRWLKEAIGEVSNSVVESIERATLDARNSTFGEVMCVDKKIAKEWIKHLQMIRKGIKVDFSLDTEAMLREVVARMLDISEHIENSISEHLEK